MKTQCDRLMGFMKSGMKNEEALTRLSMVQPRYHWIINVYGLSGDASSAYKSIAAEMVERTQAFVRNLVRWRHQQAAHAACGCRSHVDLFVNVRHCRQRDQEGGLESCKSM
jgi:hypothetical protein